MAVSDASIAMCQCTCTISSIIQLDFIIYLPVTQQRRIKFICRKTDNSVKQESRRWITMELDYFLINSYLVYCSRVSLKLHFCDEESV